MSGGDAGLVVRAALRRPRAALAPAVESVVVGDLAEAKWDVALRDVEYVIHLAARVHVVNDAAPGRLARYRAVNVDATRRLASRAAAAGARRFVFVSTIKVNGEETAPGSPFTETSPVIELGPEADPYAASKLEAERALAEVVSDTGIEVVVIRPPLVYGPGVKANFAALARAVARGIPLPFGSIDNARSLIAVDNLADLIALCIDHPAAANRVLLASDGEDLSTPDLVRRIGQAIGRGPRLFSCPPALLRAAAGAIGKAQMAHRLLTSLQVDSSTTRGLLGWKPPLTVDEALRRAAADFRPRTRGP